MTVINLRYAEPFYKKLDKLWLGNEPSDAHITGPALHSFYTYDMTYFESKKGVTNYKNGNVS